MKQIYAIFITTWRCLDAIGKMSFFLSLLWFILLVAISVATPFYFAYIVYQIQLGVFKPLVWLIGYAAIFFSVRILEEAQFATYVYFEQVFQKLLALSLLGRYYFLPHSLTQSQASTETAIIADRGFGGLRSVIFNLFFTVGPLAVRTIILVFVLYYYVSFIIACVVFVIIIAFICVTYYFSNKMSVLQEIWYKTASKNFKIFAESVKSHDTIRSLEKTKWAESRYSDAIDGFIKQVLASLSPGIIMGVIQGGLIFAIVFMTTYAIMYSNHDAKSLIPLFILTNGLVLQIINPLIQFASSYRVFIQGIASSKQLIELLTVETTGIKFLHQQKKMHSAVEVKDVKIVFPNDKSLKFSHFSLAKNSCTVVMGKSGTGKSTLARVIAGLQPYNGDLFIHSGFEKIYYLSQDVEVFDLTLEENVTLGGAIDQEKLTDTLLAAGFSGAEIRELSTRLLGEGGNTISGGQRSRLGIARMLYHNADIIIFDEPTAALDAHTAQKIRSTIINLRKHATILVVTHDTGFMVNETQTCKIEDILVS